MVELDLESSQTIQQISITLRGKIVTGSLVSEAQTFLEYKNILWHKSMGDPPSSSTPSVANKGKKTLGKFLGAYQFPFSFPFPTCVNIASYEANLICPAPQSFMEHGITASVRYELVADIVHGFLKPDSRCVQIYTANLTNVSARITTNVSYLPCISSSLPSAKRIVAQENDVLAPGPLSDPDGWFALSSSVFKGQLKGAGSAREVTIDHALSYTRGTFIPCYLRLSSEDSDALNTLSAPNALSVRLVRRLRHFLPYGGDAVSAGAGVTSDTVLSGMFTTVISEMAEAVWWVPPKDVPQEPYTRYLEGEIHLSRGLEPSSTCPLFQIEV
ncbi:hypothetical protein GALMADRAFT_118051, partial [Galerina marginata CBS 339.88]